jgi:hypothetical protein
MTFDDCADCLHKVFPLSRVMHKLGWVRKGHVSPLDTRDAVGWAMHDSDSTLARHDIRMFACEVVLDLFLITCRPCLIGPVQAGTHDSTYSHVLQAVAYLAARSQCLQSPKFGASAHTDDSQCLCRQQHLLKVASSTIQQVCITTTVPVLSNSPDI